MQTRTPPDTVFNVSWGKQQACMICLKADNTDVNNSSSPASVITRGLTPLFWHTLTYDSCPHLTRSKSGRLNGQKLALTPKTVRVLYRLPCRYLTPSLSPMGLHRKSSRLTALGLINPVMGAIKTGLGNLNCSQSLPAGL